MKNTYYNLILQKLQSKRRLLLGLDTLDHLFHGFTLGDFSVIQDSSAIQSLLPSICVKAQFPYQLGGLETNVLFVDGANVFRLYEISNIVQMWELDPKDVLERIFISRAFTVYQLVLIILNKLQTAVTKYETKVVIISNLPQLFLDKEIPKKEAVELFNQVVDYLSTFAEKNQVILIVTHKPYHWSKRIKFFKQTLYESANIVMSIKKSNQTPYFELEKHPFLQLGKTEFPSKEYTLLDFVKG